MELVIATNWVKVFKQDEIVAPFTPFVFVSREESSKEEDGGSPYVIQIRFEVEDGIEVKVASGYADEDKRDDAFDKIDGKKVLAAVNGISKKFFKQEGE